MQDCSNTGVPVGTTEQIRYGQNLIKGRSTRRYYRTYQIQNRTYSDTELIGYRSTRRYYRNYTETDLIRYRSTRRYCRTDQIQNLSDTGVPVGTTEQIRYGQNLIKCRSTRRYYRTDQIQDLNRCRSTRRYNRTDQIRAELNQLQEYP